MNFVDIIAMLAVIGALAILTFLTKGKGSCSGCHKDCSQCFSGKSLYENYKKDQQKKQ